MQTNKLIQIAESFKGKKIGVVGDLMLDRFMWGNAERISPEAPVPVVLVEKESFMPGGAGNTAANVVALGAEAFITGLVGKDFSGKILLEELKKRGIKTQGIIEQSQKPTVEKTRIVAGSQHIARVDKEDASSIDKKTEELAIKFVSDNLKAWDGIIVSDYGKGFITETLAKKIVELAKKYKKPIIGDIKPQKHAAYFEGIDFLTPNSTEAVQIAGQSNIELAGKEIQKKINCNVLITRGPEGITLLEGKITKHFPALAKKVFDIVGAGDTVAASFCLGLASNACAKDSAFIASHAAAIVVEKIGTATASLQELKERIKNG